VCGFDFIIDDVSKDAMLIEINPQATQINHLHWGSGVNLPTALRRALDGQVCASASNLAPQPAEVALFPQEWLRDPTSPYLAGAFHDVPYEEPELIKFYGCEPPSGAAAEFAAAGRADSLIAMTSDAVPPPDGAIASAAMGDAPTSCDAVQLGEGAKTLGVVAEFIEARLGEGSREQSPQSPQPGGDERMIPRQTHVAA
jgi:hypothetical protein